jgi:hypothetical protein
VSQRYFHAEAQVYEAMRTQLDSIFGHPSAATLTVYDPVGSAIRDAEGRCYLAMRAAYCDWEEVAESLVALLESGAVTEISKADYLAVASPPADSNRP